MAIYRQVQIDMWRDRYVGRLQPLEKLFFVYLLTNDQTSQCGVYEFDDRSATFDTGISWDDMSGMLKQFQDDGKIKYDEQTHEIMLINWLKYNVARSPKVAKVIDKELMSVKNTEFRVEIVKNCIAYHYPIDTKLPVENTEHNSSDRVSIPYPYSTDSITQPEPEPEPSSEPEPTSTTEPSRPDKSVSETVDVDANPIKFYEQNFGKLKPAIRKDIYSWLKSLTPELIVEALKRAALNSSGYAYAKVIMSAWSKAQVKTLADVERLDQLHEQKKQNAKSMGQRVLQKETLPDWAQPGYEPPIEKVTESEKREIAQNLADFGEHRAKKGVANA
jgi:DnaD/phage-associated family protein